MNLHAEQQNQKDQNMASPQSKSFLRKKLKAALIVLAVLVSVSLAVLVAAFIFAPLQQQEQQPVFINKDPDLRHKLNIPELLQPRIENGEKVFDLTVQQGKTEFLQGKQTKTLGYNGSYLGPTIRAHQGDKIRLNVTNTLPDPTTVHWHGMHLPAVMDGGIHQLIQPSEHWQPYWTITNQAATLWYHSHLMGKTGEQVYRGLGGLFIVDDDNSDSLVLPREYGVDDIPLIVQDRRFDDKGQLVYNPEHSRFRDVAGMLGDTILVNGTYAPYVNVPAKQIRLRILNGSNARRYNFGFKDNRTFYQIATDDGFLENPVARTRMVLAPAERAEIVVDLSKDTTPLTLISDAVNAENRNENQTFQIIELRPQRTMIKQQELSQKLNTIAPLKVTDAVKTRRFVLDWGSKGINGKSMDHSRVDLIARSGDVEIWEITNESEVYHPFHIHGVQFQILDRNGKLPPAYEHGWKDTVLVAYGETVRVITRMPEYSDPHLPYMFHCHILEHEDMGMMGQFVVVDKNTKPEDIYVESKLIESNEHKGMSMH